MTRLNVTLKRHVELEQRFLKLRDSQQFLVHQNDSLMDEVSVVREKNRVAEQCMLEAKSLANEAENALKNHRQDSQLRMRALENEVQETKLAQSSEIADLSQKINESNAQIAELNKRFEGDIVQLTQRHEEERSSLIEQVRLCESERNLSQRNLEALQKKHQTNDEKFMLLENRALSAERKYEEVRLQLENQSQRAYEENLALNNEIKSLQTFIENETKTNKALQSSHFKKGEELAVVTQSNEKAQSDLAQITKRLQDNQLLISELTKVVREQRLEIETSKLDLAEAWTSSSHNVRRLNRRLENKFQNSEPLLVDTETDAEERASSLSLINRIDSFIEGDSAELCDTKSPFSSERKTLDSIID